MRLNRNTSICFAEENRPIQHAVEILRRDLNTIFVETDMPGGTVLLKRENVPPESWSVTAQGDTLVVSAGEHRGFI